MSRINLKTNLKRPNVHRIRSAIFWYLIRHANDHTKQRKGKIRPSLVPCILSIKNKPFKVFK